MVALLISSFLSFFIFLVLGFSVSKFAKFPANFTEKTLVGLVAANTTTTILSLFAPINISILICLLIFCFFLFFYIKEELRYLSILLKTKKRVIIYSLPFIIVAFIVSINLPTNFDTGLYHLQSIKWIEEYPVIPGLANLHGRFGFNNNIFTLFALTSLFEIFKQEIFSINFTLLSVFVFHFINKLYYIFKQNGITNIFIFNLAIFITILNLSSNLSSPSPDFISISFPLFILSSFFKEKDIKEFYKLKDFIPILILCAYVITVKVSTLPLILLSIFIFAKFRNDIRKLVLIIFLLGLIFLPWLVRNVILTGWLVYPMYSIDLFNFDWKVPLEYSGTSIHFLSDIKSMSDAITGWARSPGENYLNASQMSFREWFPAWWHNLIRINKLLLVASILFPIASFIGILFKKIKLDFYSITIVFISFIGIIFWLFLAPDFRFGKAFIIISALSPLLYLNFNIKIYWRPYYKSIYVFYGVIILLILSFGKKNTGFNVIRIAKENSTRLITPQIIEIPENVYFNTFNISGIKISVPVNSDQCFDHCLPCTPYLDNNITLRNGTLQSGFKHIDKENSTK